MLTAEQQAALAAFDTYSNPDNHTVNRVMNSIRAGVCDGGVEPVAGNSGGPRVARVDRRLST
jgi:hypothetical protein